MEEEILHLYQEPGIGASYTNTYGEENIRNLLKKYHSLDAIGMEKMIHPIMESKIILHAINLKKQLTRIQIH